MAGVGVGELRGGHVVVGEEERGVLFRLRAAVEMAVEQGEDAAGRLEELAAVSGEVFAAGGEGGDGALAVDQVLAGEAVGAHGGVQGGHQQGGGDSLAADVAERDADAGLGAAAIRRGCRGGGR